MEKATWEEIKALASDFKRTQASTLNQKLTERNCIDIINYLCNSKQLSLHYTTDGKTFLTSQELEKEIYEELEISDDRIEIVKLCSVLDLDSHTVDTAINKMINNDENLHIVMGSLVNASYIRRVALKINEIIKEKGRITVLELTQVFNLPKVFVENLINNNINSIIEAHKEGEMLYTNNFIRRHTGMIRGYLTRSSKPVLVSYLSQKFSVSEKFIGRIILELIDEKRILGKLDQNKTVFVPDVHLKNQKLYLHRFFEQNNYVDFITIKEIGIQNPAKFVETEFNDVVILSSCALGEGIISQLEVDIQDCDKNESYFDCFQVIPSIVNRQDLQVLVNRFIEKNDKLIFMGDAFVVSKAFIGKCVAYFDDVINIKAEEFVRMNKKSLVTILTESSFQDDFEEESGKGGEKLVKFKSGGGLRGREIKVKNVKNKYLPDKKTTNKKAAQETHVSFDFLTEEEGVDVLMKKLNGDVPEMLVQEIYQLIDKQLTFKYKSQCKSSILQTSDTAKNKADHQKFESKISLMINKIKLFEKGLAEIDVVSLRTDLTRYNLKTLCNDVVNSLFEYIAKENEFDWDSSNVTNELKTKLIGHVKHDLSVAMKSINKSLKDATDSFNEFYSSFDTICTILDIYPKKLDKKGEKSLVQELGAQYHAIISSKGDNESIEPSEVLLVTLVLIFQKFLGYPLHASGKFVPAILDFLKSKSTHASDSVDWEALKQYQDYVITTIKMHNSSQEDVDSFKQSHQDLHLKIISMALHWKTMKNL